jgi:hypothetical protein
VRRRYCNIIIISSLSHCLFGGFRSEFILLCHDTILSSTFNFPYSKSSLFSFGTLLYVLYTPLTFFKLSYFVLSMSSVQGQQQQAENEKEKESGSESRSMDSLRFLLSHPMHACLAVQEANRLMTSKRLCCFLHFYLSPACLPACLPALLPSFLPLQPATFIDTFLL